MYRIESDRQVYTHDMEPWLPPSRKAYQARFRSIQTSDAMEMPYNFYATKGLPWT